MAPATTSSSAASPARGARQPARVGPAAVAVHDDRHVVRHELRRDRRGPRTAGAAGTARYVRRAIRRRRARAPRRRRPRRRAGRRGRAGRRSTMRSDLATFSSRWYWLTRRRGPLASLRCRASDASAASIPPRYVRDRAKVWGAGAVEPGGRQREAPPLRDGERAVRARLAAPRAVDERCDGERAQEVGVEHQPRACARSESARSAPASSQYCCTAGSRSSATRGAPRFSSIAAPRRVVLADPARTGRSSRLRHR